MSNLSQGQFGDTAPPDPAPWSQIGDPSRRARAISAPPQWAAPLSAAVEELRKHGIELLREPGPQALTLGTRPPHDLRDLSRPEDLRGGRPPTSRHRAGNHQTAPTVLPVRETDQQWAMLKLFGAAATFGVVLR
jgi:hypothetical protein